MEEDTYAVVSDYEIIEEIRTDFWRQGKPSHLMAEVISRHIKTACMGFCRNDS